MAFVGSTPTVPSGGYASLKKQTITTDGTTTYTLDHTVSGANDLEVFVYNVRQEPQVAYAVVGSDLIFEEALPIGTDCYVVYQGQPVITTRIESTNIADGSVTHSKLHIDMDLTSKTVTLPELNQTITATAFVGDGSGLTGLPTNLSDLGLDNHDNITVDGSGNVGIGTMYPDSILTLKTSADGVIQNFKLSNASVGSISVSTSGTTYNTTSDRRLKDNINTIINGKEKLLAMNPVTFSFKADEEKNVVSGFIAQEMQEVIPEAVSGDPDSDEMMSMDYGRITPTIVAALQDALKEIEELKTRINELEAK
jgi:hypothetical protein